MIKSTTVIFALIILILSACEKANIAGALQEDNGCIQKLVMPVDAQGDLSATEYNLIDSLFRTNGIGHSNLRFIRTYRDSVQTYNGTYDFRSVQVLEYAKGLPVFTGSLNYSFKNGIFDSYSGKLLSGTIPDATYSLKPAQLRKLFINDIELFNHQGSKYKDSCIKAEFGYYNLNAGTGNNTENIVKAWHLTPHFYSYPEAYYQDNGKRIYYFDGIEYSH